MKHKIIYLILFLIAQSSYAQSGDISTMKAPGKGWERKSTFTTATAIIEKFFAKDVEEIKAATPVIDKKLKKQKIKALVFYKVFGYHHGSIPFANYALNQMALSSKGVLTLDFTNKVEDLSKENLAKYDVVIHNNTTHIEKGLPDYAKVLNEYIANGGGAVFIHAGSDCFATSLEKGEKTPTGGVFEGHPWRAGGEWAFQLECPEHRLNHAFHGEGFLYQDEIYMYKKESFSRERSRVLVSLDMDHSSNTIESVTKTLEKEGRQELLKDANPVSWVIADERGRVFNTNFGHRKQTFADKKIMQHLLDGICFAAGKIKAETTPSAELKKFKIVKPKEKE